MMRTNPSGILLYAKQQDITSFTSLWAVKHALHTTKVGHTGTLDSFADGLLVVLVGKLTRLVPHITAFDKTYEGVIAFGEETDTLDPTGDVIKTAHLPTVEAFTEAIAHFTGDIMQAPPLFSAVHIDGKRASDLALKGAIQEIPKRKVHIFELSIKELKSEIVGGKECVKYAHIFVRCSKGTYIRSLARDIAYYCNSVSHLIALRRLSVGSFELKNAVGFEYLNEFSINSAVNKIRQAEKTEIQVDKAKIQMSLLPVTEKIAQLCGFTPVFLTKKGAEKYINGNRLFTNDFESLEKTNDTASLAVFYDNAQFAGVVERENRGFKYGFVVPPNDFPVFSWSDVVEGRFPKYYREKGTALTIGSFDGPHIGHEALFYDVLSQENLLHGVVTFSRSLRGLKSENYAGDIVSLGQKLELCRKKGFNFAIVIDFSADFGRMRGYDFFKYLVDFCGLRFLAEGNDFHCGYRGESGMTEIKEIGAQLGFDTSFSQSIMYKEQRVSSSLIRECILKRDFLSAKMMLQRDFSYDASLLDWEKDEYRAKRRNDLVLPPKGSYNVRVILSGDEGNEQKSPYIYRMAMDIMDSEIVLHTEDAEKFPKKKSARYIQTIIFDKE